MLVFGRLLRTALSDRKKIGDTHNFKCSNGFLKKKNKEKGENNLVMIYSVYSEYYFYIS